jgi:hypothetical protein
VVEVWERKQVCHFVSPLYKGHLYVLVCIEGNLLHNLIRKNPGRLPVRVSALKKPDKKQRVKDRGCKRGEKSERERGIWKLHSWKRPEEERIGLWLDLSPLYSTLPTRFVSAACIRIQLVEIWFLSRIMFQLEFVKSLALNFLFHVWTQEKAIMHYKMAWKLTSCWTIDPWIVKS